METSGDRTLTIGEIVQILSLEGIPENCSTLKVSKVCPPGEAKEGCAVVVSDPKLLKKLRGKPTLLVVKRGLKVPDGAAECVIEVENPKLALVLLLRELYPEKHPVGISEKATIGENVFVGKDVYIGDFVFIGNNVQLADGVKIYPGSYIGNNVVIGENSVIYPNAFVGDGTVIGKNVKIYPGAVVGKEGFGFAFDGKKHRRLRHVGITVIEDDVEIGANSCVDRALLEKTVVGEGSKVDNLVQIGHNDKIGQGVILVSQVGLSGSVEVGDYSVLAGQVGVADHVKIGKGVTVTAKSGVANDLEDGKIYGANLPAVEWSYWKKVYVLLLKLPELFKRLRALEKLLKNR